MTEMAGAKSPADGGNVALGRSAPILATIAAFDLPKRPIADAKNF